MVRSNLSDGGGISAISTDGASPVAYSGSLGGFNGEAVTGRVWKVELKSAPYECRYE